MGINEDWAKVDEVCRRYMAERGMTSTDELTVDDVRAIYAEAGVPLAIPYEIREEINHD